MAKYSNLKELFTAIADAIRSKTGGTEPIIADDFPSIISEMNASENEDAILTGALKGEYYNSRITKLRKYAFCDHQGLTSINLPNVTYIGRSAFDCSDTVSTLKSAICPSLTSLGVDAFLNCSALEEVIAPKLRTISMGAFGACSKLEKIDMDGTNGDIWYAFYSSGLNTLIIRTTEGVCKLEDEDAFGDPTYGEACSIGAGKGYIYVPKALVEEYKVATNWSNYASQIRAIEDYPGICGGGAQCQF
jgi:hypothetical protein